MKKFYIYTTFGIFALAFAMGNKGKAMGPSDSQITNPVDLVVIEDNDSNNELERRRGHKRKRKIRPRRNGF